jgi:hypothetical protein
VVAAGRSVLIAAALCGRFHSDHPSAGWIALVVVARSVDALWWSAFGLHAARPRARLVTRAERCGGKAMDGLARKAGEDSDELRAILL